jgi:peptide/nickel transport system permease protein
VTNSLTVGAAVLWVVAGVGIGIISALRRGTLLDRAAMGTALVLISAPEFWLGLLVLFAFAQDIGKLKIFPGAGTYVGLTSDPWGWFTSLIMPWFVLASGSAAIFARLTRGSLIETMKEDYIRTARAKGLPERKVVRQGVRSAINPVVTLLGLEIGTLLGGAVLVETVFNIPGVGKLAYDSIIDSDFSVVQGTVLLAAMFIIVANIVVDIGYAYLDPRVRYG